MSSSKNPFVSIAEIVFVLIFSLTGPFSLLLLPVCGLQIFLNRDDAEGKRRILILSGVIAAGAAVQCLYILRQFEFALPSFREPIPSSSLLWIVLPITRVMEPIGHVVLQSVGEKTLLPIALIAYGSIVYFALRVPHRAQKAMMLLFAFTIIASGMLKDRFVLPLNGVRYYYAAQVFSIWFLCCVPQTNRTREISTGIVAIALLIMAVIVAHRPRASENSEWPAWSRIIASGLPVKIPTDPDGYFVSLPADPNGPLAGLASWRGKEISLLGASRDDAACGGNLNTVQSRIDTFGGPPQWVVRGWAKPSDHQRAVLAIVLTDFDNRVLGFGFPGFAGGTAGEGFGWAGVVQNPVADIRAFAVVSNGSAILCALAAGEVAAPR